MEIGASSAVWDSTKGLCDVINLQFPKASSDIFHEAVGHIKSWFCSVLVLHPIVLGRKEYGSNMQYLG